MAKSFKLRLFRVLPSFQSCRSKEPSTLPTEPVPSFLRPSPLHPRKGSFHHPSSVPPPRKRHASSAIGCGFGSSSLSHYLSCDSGSEPSEFKWEKEDKWHVVAKVEDYDTTPRRKIYNSSVSGDSNDDVLPPPRKWEKNKRANRKAKTGNKIRISISSAESCFFSSEAGDERDNEEMEALVSSSRSFSTDSSIESSARRLDTIRETTTPTPTSRKKRIKKTKRRKAKRTVSRGSPENWSPARLSVLHRLIPCGVDGKVRESYAVVKKSADPREDFKSSMMEMILEKQMFERKDLEQLLQCFLSLNSAHHHGIIVQAFSEIWEVLFCKTPASPTVRKSFKQRV